MRAAVVDSPGTPAEHEPVTTRPIRRSGVAWRVAVSVVGVVLLVNGTLRMTDAAWPFGPMSQYAFAPAPDSEVAITRVEGRLADGRRIDLELDPWSSGIRRADVEAQIPQIEARPELLRAVQQGWARRHPTEPPLTELWLCQEWHRLSDRTWQPVRTVTLASWKVDR